MCEFEPPISTEPFDFITGLELEDLSVKLKYFHEKILREFVDINRHPIRWLPQTARIPIT